MSHAAIVSRELGLPAIVGTLHGTELIKDKQPITLCCAEGEQGSVYDGILEFKTTEVNLADVPPTRTAMMVNIASPAAAFRWWRLPAKVTLREHAPSTEFALSTGCCGPRHGVRKRHGSPIAITPSTTVPGSRSPPRRTAPPARS